MNEVSLGQDRHQDALDQTEAFLQEIWQISRSKVGSMSRWKQESPGAHLSHQKCSAEKHQKLLWGPELPKNNR